MLVYFRDLWTFGKHPRAHSGVYDVNAGSTPVANMSMIICGHKMAISFKFADGKIKHLILNWRKFQAMVCIQDIKLIAKTYLPNLN